MTPSKRLKGSTGDALIAVSVPVDHADENLDPKDNQNVADDFNDAFLDEDEHAPQSTQTTPQRQQKGFAGSAYGASGGYDAMKSFNGQVYKGMAVGGSHTWQYQPGVWRETKVEPDLWEVDFETIKKRAKAAPQGSGAPVGTEYHWLIVAHQVGL